MSEGWRCPILVGSIQLNAFTMSAQHQSTEKHPLSSGMDHALDSETQGPVRQLRRPGDTGPEMQSAANASAQVKQLKASESAANTAVIQRKQNNETGLPDQLKSGIESLSGMSLDHVKVHYHSSKPAEVNALAYAEGNVIHVAPGQEDSLPEEAWHVVQQMQGKVKATTEVNNEKVNDDPALEREARQKGAEAAAGPKAGGEALPPAAPAPGAEGVVQRRIQPYTTTASEDDKAYYKNSVVKIADMVDSLVETARDSALNWADYAESDRNRMKLWAETADAFYQNPDVVPDFIHARFGYAIEDLVSTELPKEAENLKINLQVAAGHTRPDIVLCDDNIQVAWLDITAEESVGHIKNKDGAGWTSRPFVCEVLYDSLNLEEVLSGSGNPLTSALGSYSAEKGQIKHEVEEEEKRKLTDQLVNFANDRGYKSGVGNKGTKKTDTKQYMNTLGMELNPFNANKQAKGTLAYLEVNPLRYGFKDEGATITRAKQFIEDKAHDQVQDDIAQMQKVRLKDMVDEASNEEQCSLQQAFVKAATSIIEEDAVEDKHVKVGIAVIEVLRLAKEAHELSLEKNSSLDENEEAQSLIQEIHQEINYYMPDSLDLNVLRDWHTNMLDLVYKLENVDVEVEDESSEFSDQEELVVEDDKFD